MAERLALYDGVAEQAADVVVRRYSTSFGLATRLLPARQRTEIRNIYALVRLADEVVDGAADEAGEAGRAGGAGGAGGAGRAEWAGELLTELEQQTGSAMARGYSTNVLVHAFAGTARRAGFGEELTAPFFASMRMDLHRTEHDVDSFATYVHGSAEVIGLMCLRVFLLEEPAAGRDERYAALAPGAQALGAAFQKINFLRDLADDAGRLGRSYFPGVDPGRLTEGQKRIVLDDIGRDLVQARAAIAGLPRAVQAPVGVACALFTELAARLAATPADLVATARVSVPAGVKARIAVRVLRDPRRGAR